MTLLLTLANETYSLVLGDRRLVCNGAVCEDESNKVCVLFCDDARIAIAYTGVAVYGQFKTQDWLRDTLVEIGEKKHILDEILTELRAQASVVFAQLPAEMRSIAFLISGYCYTDLESQHVCSLLSNFDPNVGNCVAGKSLEFYSLGGSDNVIVEAAGFKSVLAEEDYSHIRMMLEAGNPAPVVLHKAVEIMQRVAKDNASRNMIGLQCNSAVVPRQVNTSIVGTYHSARPVKRAPGPAVVIAVTGCCGACAGMFVAAENAILAGPDIRKNEACWCGSGGLLPKN